MYELSKFFAPDVADKFSLVSLWFKTTFHSYQVHVPTSLKIVVNVSFIEILFDDGFSELKSSSKKNSHHQQPLFAIEALRRVCPHSSL